MFRMAAQNRAAFFYKDARYGASPVVSPYVRTKATQQQLTVMFDNLVSIKLEGSTTGQAP